MKRKQKILLISSRPALIEQSLDFLVTEYDVITASTESGVLDSFHLTKPDAIILDIALRGHGGLDLLMKLKEIMPAVPFIVTAPHDTAGEVVKLIKYRVHDYFNDPIHKDEFCRSLRKALGAKRAKQIQRRTVSVDVELFIKNAVDDIVQGDVTLQHALKAFKERYVDYIWTKSLKNT